MKIKDLDDDVLPDANPISAASGESDDLLGDDDHRMQRPHRVGQAPRDRFQIVAKVWQSRTYSSDGIRCRRVGKQAARRGRQARCGILGEGDLVCRRGCGNRDASGGGGGREVDPGMSEGAEYWGNILGPGAGD